jgi:hypothetical protein
VLQADTCIQDSLGIPRCAISEGGGGGDNCVMTGMQCASSADCCDGAPCVPSGDELGTLICGGACVNPGNACTTSTDCCDGSACVNGSCSAPQGCSEYGQGCDTTADCCGADVGVTCQGGPPGTCLGVLL